jgi:small subunit ribosomal protein S5
MSVLRKTKENVRNKESELANRLIKVNRVSKVVKGGKRFGFSALVVVGDREGKVGCGMGSARDVAEAVRKATEKASRAMFKVPLKEGRTIHHDVEASFGAGKVLLRSAPSGSGIIAGWSMRAVFEALGLRDIVSKSLRSSTPHNVVKATMKALGALRTPRDIANKRRKRVADIFSDGSQKKQQEA